MTYKLAIRVMIFAFILIFFQGVIYYDVSYYLSDGGFYLNVPDHVFYSELVSFFDVELSASAINNFAIVALYTFVIYFFNVDLVAASLLVNFSILIFSYARAEVICFDVAGKFLPFLYRLAFLLILPFSVFINKDSFGVLFYILLVSFLVYKRKRDFVLLLFVFPLRLQFPLIFLFALFIFTARGGGREHSIVFRVVLLYFFVAAMSLYVERTELLFSKSGYTEGGVSYWMSFLNSNYYIGSFILNILKPLQYLYDLYRGAFLDYSFIAVFVYLIKIYVVIVLGVCGVSFLRAIYTPWFFYNKTEIFAFSSVICSFFLVYMISPVVDYRYFMNIIPVFLLLFSMRCIGVK